MCCMSRKKQILDIITMPLPPSLWLSEVLGNGTTISCHRRNALGRAYQSHRPGSGCPHFPTQVDHRLHRNTAHIQERAPPEDRTRALIKDFCWHFSVVKRSPCHREHDKAIWSFPEVSPVLEIKYLVADLQLLNKRRQIDLSQMWDFFSLNGTKMTHEAYAE